MTPALVDAMGISKIEGPFRTCCIVALRVLRENRYIFWSMKLLK